VRKRSDMKDVISELRSDVVLGWAGADEERPFDREGRMVRRHSRSMV